MRYPPGNDGETDCGDGVDNDGDDAIDGEDPDCGTPPGNDGETDCGDGVDNDGDDAIDGEDPDWVFHRVMTGRQIVVMV